MKMMTKQLYEISEGIIENFYEYENYRGDFRVSHLCAGRQVGHSTVIKQLKSKYNVLVIVPRSSHFNRRDHEKVSYSYIIERLKYDILGNRDLRKPHVILIDRRGTEIPTEVSHNLDVLFPNSPVIIFQ